MSQPDLESRTAERLLRGAIGPEDAPPEYRQVAQLFQDLVPAAGPPGDDAAAVATLAETIRANPAPAPAPARRRRSLFARCKLAVVGLTGALSLTTGLAAANALPGPAQAAASDVLETVGVNVPAGHDATHSTGRHAPRSQPPLPSASQSSANKGSEISDLATTTDATGADKGAAVSGAASEGTSHAGEPRPSDEGPTSSTPTTTTTKTDSAGSANDHGQATSSAAHDSHNPNPNANANPNPNANANANAGHGGPPASVGPPMSVPAQASNSHRP
jgi:hypothetical protein